MEKEKTVLMSALVVPHEDNVRIPSKRMDDRHRNQVDPVLVDGSVPVPGTNILATAFAETIGEPTGTTDDELLQFAAEIELGEPIRKLM